jgi:hypothetical protein
MVGIATFDSAIHFYSLKRAQQQVFYDLVCWYCKHSMHHKELFCASQNTVGFSYLLNFLSETRESAATIFFAYSFLIFWALNVHQVGY